MDWPAYTVGAFFLALVFYDMITNDWIDLPYHAVIGLVVTGLYTLICMFVSVTVAGAALLIPAVALLGFMLAIWMSGESLKRRGCCVTCADAPATATAPTPPTTPPAPKPASDCPQRLNATPQV